MTDAELRRVESATFRAAVDTGLWDIIIASVFLMFSIAPLLSTRLGDFGSVVVFLPLWIICFLLIRVVHKRVVEERIGVVRFGQHRKNQLRKLSLVMLVVNVVAFVLGVIAALNPGSGQMSLYPIGLAVVLLVGFSLAALLLQIPRLFFYGVLLTTAAITGEVLWQRGLVGHHGYPLMFGISTAVIAACGLLRFIRHVLRDSGGSGGPGMEELRRDVIDE